MKENFSVTKTLVEDENGELVIEFSAVSYTHLTLPTKA